MSTVTDWLVDKLVDEMCTLVMTREGRADLAKFQEEINTRLNWLRNNDAQPKVRQAERELYMSINKFTKALCDSDMGVKPKT
jgi:hypothetical protein